MSALGRSTERSDYYSEGEVEWHHQSRMLLLKAWLIGPLISIFAVVCTFVVHTPVALVGMILSVPMLPFMFIFDLVTRGMSMGDITMSIALPASLAFFGSFVYGGIALLVIWINQRRRRKRG